MTLNKKEQFAYVERTLRLCALEIDGRGRLRALAKEMGVSPQVYRYWIGKGKVPPLKAEWLERRFPNIASAALLVGADT